MRKLNYLLLGALGLTMASCANEDLVSNVTGDEANVSITLSTPQIQSRTYSDGTTAQKLQYAVYKVTTDATTGTKTLSRTDYFTTNESINLEKQVSFKLVSGHTYGFVFWASCADAPYYVTLNSDGAVMDIDYGDPRLCANNEKLDAFFAYEELYVTGDQAKTIYLYRPFAQINVGTSDLEDAAKAGYTPAFSHLTIDKVFKTLNLVTGEVSNQVENGHDYAFSAIPSGETFPYTDKSVTPNVTFDYLTMVYALVDNTEDQPVVEVEFCTTDADAIEHAGEHTVGSVPVKRNYRTNIFGQLLTSSVDVNVVIEPAYEKPDYLVNHDGVEYDADSSTFTITNAHGLEWLANRVNSHDGKDNVNTDAVPGVYGSPQCSFYGQKVVLANDIDMNECYSTRGNTIDFLFQPIGYQTKADGSSIYAFAGEFDGQNHTISNLKISAERNNHAALFGYINGATIKNLTIKDFDIQGHYKTAALVADARNSVIENVTVTDGKVLSTPWEKTPGVWDDGNNAGGLVAYYDNQPLTGSIKNCKVEEVEVTAYRRLGGLAGRIGARDDINPHTCGIEVSGNTVSNVKLTADMTEVRYDGFKNNDSYFDEKSQIGELYGLVEIQSYANPNIDQNNNYSEVTKEILKPAAIAESTEEMVSALQNVKDGDIIVVNGDLEKTINNSFPTGVTFTIKGVGMESSSVLFDYANATDCDITFENITIHPILNGTNHTASGLKGIKAATFNNVRFDCEFATYTGDLTFNDCLFTYNANTDANKGGRYGPYIYGGNITLNNCVFDQSSNDITKTKGILIYPLGSPDATTMGDVVVNNCKFIGGKIANDKNAAVEIHTESAKTNSNLTINNTTYDASTYPGGLWREVNGSKKYFTVVVDGKTEQTAE